MVVVMVLVEVVDMAVWPGFFQYHREAMDLPDLLCLRLAL
jgi:hypothetical protein